MANLIQVNEMWLDILKFLTIAITIHILLYAVDNHTELFDEFSLRIFLYIIISLIVYHLIVKKFIYGRIFNTKKENFKKLKKKICKNKKIK